MFCRKTSPADAPIPGRRSAIGLGAAKELETIVLREKFPSDPFPEITPKDQVSVHSSRESHKKQILFHQISSLCTRLVYRQDHMFVGDKQNFLRNNSSAGGRRVAGLPKHGERKRRSPNGTACAGGASVKKNDEEVPERQEPGQSSMEDQRNLCTSRRYICWPEQSLGF